jgi:hypothetical protein
LTAAAKELYIVAALSFIMALKQILFAQVRRHDSGYEARCVAIPVAVEGRSLEETLASLQLAIQQCLQQNDPTCFGLAPKPVVLVGLYMGSFDLPGGG